MMTLFWISFAALWIVVFIQGFMLLEVLAQVGQLRTGLVTNQRFIDPDALAGREVPAFAGLHAGTLAPASWDEYLGEQRGVAVLLTTRCKTCRAIARQLTRYVRKRAPEAMSIFAIVQGPLDEATEFIVETRIDPDLVAIDPDASIGERLGVTWSPGVIAIDKSHVAGAAVIGDMKQLEEFIERVASRPDTEDAATNAGDRVATVIARE